MRMLAIETATEACSVALFEDGALIGAFHETIGRGHAERLVPMIAELPGKGRADMIRVSLGPGSFTGVRIGLATARALGVAWNVPVQGYPTLALVAHMARERVGDPLVVVMNGGHGEWFVQPFDNSGRAEAQACSLAPEAAREAYGSRVAAGNRAAAFHGEETQGASPIELLPDARYVAGLAIHDLTPALAPIYGRAPDARPPGQ